LSIHPRKKSNIPSYKAVILSDLTVIRAIRILSRAEIIRYFQVILIQIILGLLDVAGVLIIGLLGSLAVSGISSGKPGDRVSSFLKFVNLEGQPLQTQIAIMGLAAATLLIFKTLFSLYFTRRTLFFLSRRAASLSTLLTSKLLGRSLLRVQARSIQETIYSLTTGVTTITVGILGSTAILITDLSLLIILTAGLFLVDTLIAILTLIIFGLLGFALYRIMHVKVRKLGNLQATATIASNEKLAEVLQSYRELVVRNRRSFYASEIGKLRMSLSNVTAQNIFYQNISKYVLELAMVVGALVISAIQFSTQSAGHSIAVLSIFLAASSRIVPAVLRVQQGALSIKGNIATAKPTLDLIDELGTEPIIEKSDDVLDLLHAGFSPNVLIQDLSFSYPQQEELAISGINLEIKEGSIVAIVGSSGAGKTTLVDLLLGVLEPSGGKVLISGRSPLETIKNWPGAISYVPQDVTTINGTIRENIAMGYPEDLGSDNLIREALEVAHLLEFVLSMPEGFDTHVGDRGTRISGGQRQRLGIARAMFTCPQLLILDEATSALDGETESNISDAIQAMRGRVTVLMIAHRLSTVRNADVVVYMDSGVIVATGSFDEVRQKVTDFDRQARMMGL
jgi:ABC-type multidrug transport system fused ATPase/permease subunit